MPTPSAERPNLGELREQLAAILCPGCKKGYPLKKGRHQTWDDGSVDFRCEAHETIKEILPIIEQREVPSACGKPRHTMASWVTPRKGSFVSGEANRVDEDPYCALCAEIEQREREARIAEAKLWNEHAGFDHEYGQPYRWCRDRIIELSKQKSLPKEGQ